MRFFTALLLFIFTIKANQSTAQTGCFSTGLNGSSINLACNVSCSPFQFQVPHLKSTSDYSVVSIPYAPVLPLVTSTGTEVSSIYDDDEFSAAYTIPFSFCFYDSTFTQFVVGSNGVMTFAVSNASCSNAWDLSVSESDPVEIPFMGTQTCTNSTGPKYPAYSIMSPYHDINPASTTSSPNRKIEWRVEGAAPCRKLIVTFYKIPLFGDNSKLNTSQIVMYESTGIIDIYVEQKSRDNEDTDDWNEDLAILGIQKNATKALAAPGKNATAWEENNTAYRFIPSGPVSRFVKAQLLDLSGNLLAETGVTAGADTATTVAGLLDLNFPQQCPTANVTQYIVKTYYSSCGDPNAEIVSTDTITINKTTSLNATVGTIVPSACGPNGSFTLNIPTGAGTPPYTLVLDGGTPVTITGQSHTFTGLIGGSHSVVVTSPGGCAQTVPVTIPSSGILTVTATVTAPTCVGASNGTITLTPQNGVAPFSYLLSGMDDAVSSPDPSYTFNDLTAGGYGITITDASGCILSNMLAIVPAGPELTINIVATPPACAGASNGTITVNPATGTAPFTYSIGGGPFQTSNVFSNLASGSYFVSVLDAIGCYKNFILVTIGPSTGTLNATAMATGTSCTGVNNGSITISPTNGSAPYQYSINGGTSFQTGTTISGLAPGSYSVIVKDNGGCTSAPIPVTVSAGNALLATTVTSPTSCTGVNNGSVTITPTNGASPYSYSLDNGPAQSSNVFNNLSAGNHSIVVTDGSGCVSNPIAVTIAVGPAITGTAVSTATSCNGAANGSITVTANTGAAPYTYQLDGGAFQSAATFNNVASGNHTVVISDAAGCTSAAISVTVAVGPALTGTATSTSTSCSGATDGTITATATNGSAPFEYSLDNTTWQASNNFTGLAPGAHSIYIRDAAGCSSAAIAVNIAAGAALTATTATTPTSCSGAVNGTITVNPTNGVGPFEYSIDGINFQSSNTFSGLATGSYTITFRNNSSCQSTIDATVSAGQPLTATVATTNVFCNGNSTGEAQVNISSNGAPPYEYSLDGTSWQSSNSFAGLAAGNYTVYFRDQNNCAGTQTFSITQPAPLTIAPAQQAALCNGQSNGTIMIGANGGTAPYQYSIDGVNYQASNAFNVAAGGYTVYVRDANNCVSSEVVNINEPAVLSATAVTGNATCDGGNNGIITVSALGGTSAYQYSINGTNFQASNVFNVSAGSYTVITRDVNGCVFNQDVVVGLTNNLSVIPANDTITCEGVSVQLQPVSNATHYSWSPAQGLSAINVKEPIATPSVTTDYIVNTTLGVCTAYDTIRVNVLPAPIPNAGVDGDICFGQSFTLQGSGGTGFDWSPSTYLNTTLTSDPVVTPTQTIQYTLHVTGANGCRSLQPDVVTVNVTPPIVVTMSKDTAVALGDVLQLYANSVGTSYEWSPVFGLDDPNKATPYATITGDITYTCRVTTNAGCKGEGTVTLKVFDGPEIYVPTAFTPNGDGKNDLFTPFPVGIKNYTYFRIFNRWGQVIFSTTDFNRGWDGTINGKPQPGGVYVWVVEGTTKEDKKLAKKGTITLIR